MSCPDWSALATWRASRDGQEPAGWQDAVSHLDTCGRCRGEALAADPTLLFRRLPALGVDALDRGAEDDEVAAMQQAVAAMRTASRLEREPRRSAAGLNWKRWAAVAAVTATAGGLGTWYELPARQGAEKASSSSAFNSPMAPASPAVPAALIEDFDRPNARVQEYKSRKGFKGKGAAIYDPSFDVSSVS